MDLTGSIADTTNPLSLEFAGSLMDGGGLTGSSFVDTMAMVAVALPNVLLQIAAGIGADLGSTIGGPDIL